MRKSGEVRSSVVVQLGLPLSVMLLFLLLPLTTAKGEEAGTLPFDLDKDPIWLLQGHQTLKPDRLGELRVLYTEIRANLLHDNIQDADLLIRILKGRFGDTYIAMFIDRLRDAWKEDLLARRGRPRPACSMPSRES